MAQVLVPDVRWLRWVENFERAHGPTSLHVRDGALLGTADDGSRFAARLPFGRHHDGDADASGLLDAVGPPEDWGVLLVRRGGFAVARLQGHTVVASKVGQRHVQGKTKAGGQSQQRFARRRANQADQAFAAAAEHALRVLGHLRGPLVTGGDRGAVAAVLADAHLARLEVVDPWLAVPDPRRSVLDQAVVDACSLRVEVENAD